MPRRSTLLALALVAGSLAATEYEPTLQQGLQSLANKDFPAARQKLEQAADLKPEDPRVWLALAQTYLQLKKPEQAEQAAGKAAVLGPDDPVTLHGLAMYHAAAGHWQQAAEAESNFARHRTGDSDAVIRAAGFHLRASEPRKAVEILQWGISNENRADLQVLLAQALAAAGEPRQAVAPLQEAIRLQPYEERLYFELSRLQLQIQDAAGALDVVTQGREIFDKSPHLELMRGIALYSQRRFTEAVDAFLLSAELAPDMGQPHAFLGRILTHAHDRMDEVTARFAAFEKAHPDTYLGPYLHAIALLEGMGPSLDDAKAAEAERLLTRALELKEDHADSHFELGALLSKQREFERAEEHLERAVQLDPKSSKAHYHLARVYLRLGKTEQARAEQELHEKLTEQERQAMRSGMGSSTESAFSDVVQ